MAHSTPLAYALTIYFKGLFIGGLLALGVLSVLAVVALVFLEDENR